LGPAYQAATIRGTTRCARIVVDYTKTPLREGFGMEKRILLVEDDARFREAFTR